VEEQQRAHDLLTAIQHTFNAERGDVRLVRAPLRICPLGAHIDHQLGLVTGITIDAPILLAYVPNPTWQVRIHSFNFTIRDAVVLRGAVVPMGSTIEGQVVS